MFSGVMLIVVLSGCLLIGPACGNPVPRNFDLEGKEGNNVEVKDAVNEEVADGKVQQLGVDLLPNQNNDAAGDGQLQQPDPDNEGDDDDAGNLGRQEVDGMGPGIADAPGQADATDMDKHLKLIGEMVDKVGKLQAEQLAPVDHLDVVKMEQDGHVNRDYHKEMFLGGQHDEFRSDSVDHAQVKLKDIVARADKDGDGSLSSAEMEAWIKAKMSEHFLEASEENDKIFVHLDPDGDGFIKWKEYYIHFLLSRGFDPKSSMKHVQDYDDSVQLDQADKDALVSYKFRWMEADSDPMDNQLTKEEFMAFRHPEHSKRSLETMARNVFRGVDTNDDKVITEDEFIMLPPGEVENEEYAEMDRKWQEERKKEFREIMDLNHDGQVDMKEMENYLDPTNPLQARLEADSLLSLMDDDKNSLLSMEEILKHSDIFISSKIINFAANVHDEF
ncbi:45 kDa calcium-binding protein [Aplysia californica]|uniref:45 kDa calcium-binding protein n=1 Tax=Aplysia californica TaxID=6500 RepID=A0ABM1AAD6_APLCA|nr:45 kDa calcium-binding protein [Aplysia californica]